MPDPTADHEQSAGCPCDFYDATPLAHDRLAGLERMPAVEAALLVAELIGDDDNLGDPCPIFIDPHDFRRFVMQHNWDNPVAMARLAEAANYASDQAWHWRTQKASSHSE